MFKYIVNILSALMVSLFISACATKTVSNSAVEPSTNQKIYKVQLENDVAETQLYPVEEDMLATAKEHVTGLTEEEIILILVLSRNLSYSYSHYIGEPLDGDRYGLYVRDILLYAQAFKLNEFPQLGITQSSEYEGVLYMSSQLIDSFLIDIYLENRDKYAEGLAELGEQIKERSDLYLTRSDLGEIMYQVDVVCDQQLEHTMKLECNENGKAFMNELFGYIVSNAKFWNQRLYNMDIDTINDQFYTDHYMEHVIASFVQNPVQ